MSTRESRPDIVGRWLRNGVYAALLVFLGMCSFLLYRVSRVVYRVEEAVVRVTADVQRVTGTVAGLSDDVHNIRDDLLAAKEEVMPGEETRQAIDEALEMTQSLKRENALPPESDQEIKALLQGLLTSRNTVHVGETEETLIKVYAELYTRYRLRKHTLTSAEEFIREIATHSFSGKPLYVVEKDKTEQMPLDQWFTARLKEIRARKAG